MKVQLRDPNTIMKLSRLGSFHQSKLSFLRSFLNEFKDWEYKRDLFNLDKFGYGEAVYSFRKDKRTRKVAMMDTGTVTAGTSVALALPRNTKIVRTTRKIAIPSVL